MRIWSFPSFYPNQLPGRRWNGIFAHRQNIGLVANGAEVYVVQPVHYKWPGMLNKLFPCTTDLNSGNLSSFRQQDGIPVYHPVIADPRPSRLFHADYGIRYKKAVRKFFGDMKVKFGPDDFFYAQWIPEAGMVAALGKEYGVKTGVLMIGDDVLVLPKQNSDALEFLGKTLETADFRFAVSRHLAAEACHIIGKDFPIHVVRRGVDYDFFQPSAVLKKNSLRAKHNIPANRRVCVCVGTMMKAKGWIELLDAVAELRHSFPDFLLLAIHAGNGDLDFMSESEKRGLQLHCIDIGEVAPAQMPEWYQLADMFCLPSHSEGISNAVAEAMASGLPVITTSLPGHLELIKHLHSGWLVPPQNTTALQDAFTGIMSNDALAKKLGESAREFIVNEWGSFADNSRRIIEVLSQGNSHKN